MIGRSSSAAISASVVVVMVLGLGCERSAPLVMPLYTMRCRGQPSSVTDRHSCDAIERHS
jgi:hypothetical protein